MAVFKKEREETTRPSGFSSPVTVQQSKSIIGKSLFVNGEITSDEELIIEGKVEGKLNVKHRVIIEKNGIINAEIEGREIIIKGRVNGNVKSNYKVEIVPGGILNGNIRSDKVVLAEGAIFKGNISMKIEDETPKKPAEKMKIDEKKEEKDKKDQDKI